MPFISVRGRKAFVSAGDSPVGTGKSVLFVHGAAGDHLRWDQQISYFGKNNYAVAVDLPGHGSSLGEALDSVDGYAEWLRDAVAALGLERFVLAGHSMGGAIALTFAIRHQELLEGLILVSTGARLRVDPARLQSYRRGEYREEWTRASFSPKASEELVARAVEDARGVDTAVRLSDFLACDGFDVMGKVGAINVPALVICGADDVATPPKFSRYLCEKMPNSQVRIVEDAGHMVMMEQPRAVSLEIERFLEHLRTPLGR